MRRHIDRHLNTLKEKPHHVRERVALGAAGAVTGLVALVWLTSLVSSGSLALRPPSELTGTEATSELAETGSNLSELMGAVGAVGTPSDAEPELTIVNGETSSTLTAPPPQPPSDATVIAF